MEGEEALKVETRGQMNQRHKLEISQLKRQGLKKQELKKLQKQLHAKHEQEKKEFGERTAKAAIVSDSANENKHLEKKLSRQQRRKQNKAEAEKERRLQVEKEIAEAKDQPTADTIEMQDLLEQLKNYHNPDSSVSLSFQSIKSIRPDGNCLYDAVLHQLRSTAAVSCSSSLTSVSSLRSAVADHIRQHRDEYEAFLDLESVGVGDGEDAFMSYCNRIATTAEWGGEPELKAITEVLSVNIVVHQANQPPQLLTIDGDGTHPYLHVSFHRQAFVLGNHYNSVMFTELLNHDPDKENE